MSNATIVDLLPPYMTHQAWVDLAECMEELFQGDVLQYSTALRYIRDRFMPLAEDRLAARTLIDNDEFSTFDVLTNRLRLNYLGFQVSDPSVVSDASLLQFTRNVGQYWFEKGLANSADFLAFCLNAEVTCVPLWTEDYVTFVEQASASTPIWKGGTWYPTTHVRMRFDSAHFNSAQMPVLVRLFYDLANYNLVLESVVTDTYSLMLTVDDYPGTESARGVEAKDALAMHLVPHLEITERWFSE